ncbi:MAG: protein kinase [Pseudomonadota bacterium]
MSENAAGLTLTAGARLHQRYELKRQLYARQGGAVWLARDLVSSGDVVVKLANDSAVLRREWETLRALNNAHIVRAFDFADEAPALFAQYFVDGPSLADLGAVEFNELLRPMRLVVQALGYLHRRDVSHGDVAPSNILFDHGGAPFLIDFGSATRGELAIGAGNGTPAYRSPERGSAGLATPADDIFALGRILGEFANATIDPALRALIDAMVGPAEKRPDAAAVDAALESAGVAATVMSAARVRRVETQAATVSANDAIETVRAAPVTRAAQPAAAPVAAKSTSGLSVPMVVGALVVLLALFAAALYFIDREPPAPSIAVDDEPVGETELAEAVDDAGADEPTWRDQAPSAFDEEMEFNEGSIDSVLDTSRLSPKQRAGRTLGELLAKQEVLEGRGVNSWAPVEYERALGFYESGDKFYLADDFANAETQYRKAIVEFDLLIGRVTGVFTDTVSAADAAFASGESREAERLYGIALEITPNDPRSVEGLERARKLDEVLALVEAGGDAEFDGDFEAAKVAYDKALVLDANWQAAAEGSARAAKQILDQQFRDRMTDGFLALDAREFIAARRAFRAAQQLRPESREPADGLLQVDQADRLGKIRILRSDAEIAEQEENWPAAVELYKAMLEQDDKLALARDGLTTARSRVALDETIKRYLDDPDLLTNPKELRAASGVLSRMTAIDPVGPRLAEQREQLTAALKRAATPIKVELVSDELTEVAVFKVGRLGQFNRTTLVLRPGLYTAVGTRLGYRDVRLEFRVSPDDPPKPVIVRCEEPI